MVGVSQLRCAHPTTETEKDANTDGRMSLLCYLKGCGPRRCIIIKNARWESNENWHSGPLFQFSKYTQGMVLAGAKRGPGPGHPPRIANMDALAAAARRCVAANACSSLLRSARSTAETSASQTSQASMRMSRKKRSWPTSSPMMSLHSFFFYPF